MKINVLALNQQKKTSNLIKSIEISLINIDQILIVKTCFNF